ncbi:MAG TPA: agmatine deiminase family protein [Ignavibacteria bacterium]|nr:agmatine deiminase family protein [Ignavibacteria bacterium]
MIKKITFLMLFLAFGSMVFGQDLPKYLTQQEKDFLRMNGGLQLFQTDDNNPPPGSVRTMAEWEETQGIVVKWMSFIPILTEIVRYASQEGLVFILCIDSNAVKTTLTNASIPLTNIRYVRGYNVTSMGNNSIWSRDYGPWAVYSGVADTLRLVDWIYNRPRPGDDTNSVTIAQYLNTPIHRTLQAPNDLVNTGGNFMVDGHGTGFASKLILTENQAGNPYGVSVKNEAQIDGIMSNYMGISRFIKMNTLPYDQIHHIDMHMKLLDEETLLVGQYPPGVADGPQIEANLQYVLNNFQTCFGKPYKVVRIPMPPENGQYPNNGGDYRTYTNSLIVNKTVIMPTYELRYDTTAFRIYREAMPGYNIVGVNSNAIIPSLGTIHCITKEIGVNEPIFISHSAIRDNDNTSSPYPVKAYIDTKSGVASARVFWRTDTTQAYNQLNMSVAGDTFTANIPAQPLGTVVYYYVSATSVSGKTINKPLPAPTGYIKFRVDNSTSITGNTGNVVSYELAQNYPNPFNPVTEIRFAIPGSEHVSLKVYDLSGKLIRTLVDDFRSAGSYRINFNADGLSSGVYFYKLTSGSFTQVKKMMLLK